MRRVTLSLAVLAVVGLAASTAWAGTPAPKVSLHVGPTLVGHHGPHGHLHGHRYGPHPHWRHPYRRGVVILPPLVPPPPAVIYRVPSYPPYPPYPPYYRPRGGIRVQGKRVGITIGF